MSRSRVSSRRHVQYVQALVLPVAVLKSIRSAAFVCQSRCSVLCISDFYLCTREKSVALHGGISIWGGWGGGGDGVCNGISHRFCRFQIHIKACLFSTLFVFNVQFSRNHLKHSVFYVFRLL
jgi:hypothetical protein